MLHPQFGGEVELPRLPVTGLRKASRPPTIRDARDVRTSGKASLLTDR
jgi:hypothetical protein